MRELLLCSPDNYGIEYEINPWMSRARGAEAALAQEQWRGLHATLSKLDCEIELVPPQPKLPDMVFTANAGLTVGRQFIPSNFRHKERAGEAPHFARWMEKEGYQISFRHQITSCGGGNARLSRGLGGTCRSTVLSSRYLFLPVARWRDGVVP